MQRKGSEVPHKPRAEYRYTVKDIADLAGMTTNAVNVAKARGKIDPGNLKSVVSFLTRIVIQRRLKGDLFALPTEAKKSVLKKKGIQVPRKKTKKAPTRE